MMTSMQPSGHSRQRGISLFVVLVMVLITTLLVLWGSRSALLNEMIVGTDSDYQRAFEAAQAVVRDAEFDIKGERSDGTPCSGSECRAWGTIDVASGSVFYPETMNEFVDLEAALSGNTPPCAAGICLTNPDPTYNEFWKDQVKLNAMIAKASSYGVHTGAKAGAVGNPLLAQSTAHAWYWVEVLPYDAGSKFKGGAADDLGPDEKLRPFVYRITGIAKGLRSSTQAVVQSTLVLKKTAS